MPLISVSMASYNHSEYLSQAIESVLNQTFRDLELIIIDDASQDASRSCIENYAGQDDRIRTIFHDKNQGIAFTANQGMAAAKGKYITFIDSDDVWMPEKLQKQIDILARDENLVVWSEGLIIDETDTPTGETFTGMNHSQDRERNGYIFEDLLKGNHILASSMIFKRENLRGIKFNDQFEYLNDFQFNVEMARLYKFYFIQEPLVYYRVHSRSTVQADYEGHILDYPKVGLYFLEKYGQDISNAGKIQIFRNTTEYLQGLISQQRDIISQQKNTLNIPGTGFRPLVCRFFCLLITGKLHIYDITNRFSVRFSQASQSSRSRSLISEGCDNIYPDKNENTTTPGKK